MSHAARFHRELDRRAAQAMGEAPGHALMRSRDRMKDQRSMTDRKSRVLLLEAEIRTSERSGRTWYSAWPGKARLIGFEADEPNDRGHRVIRFFAEEPEPRDGQPTARQRTGDRYRNPRPEGARARQERVAGEIPNEHGDGELNDPLPF